ncbi:hypothetical protein THAOC_04856, partial [Thalassiosira oceanica]
MDHQQDSVGALLSLLESYPPEVLSPFLERVENLALNVRRSRCQQRDAPLEQLDASSIDSVLSNGHLLAMILEYDGSLAMGHKHYGSLVGYEHPLPSPNGFARQYIQGTASHALVCKKWRDLVVGRDGLAQWKDSSTREVERKVAIARRASTDESLTWTARLSAMAISNDVGALRAAFRDPEEDSAGVGAALSEQRNPTIDSDDD